MDSRQRRFVSLVTDLWREHNVVAHPRDLRFGVGLSLTVEETWFTLLEVTVLRLRHPHRGGCDHTQSILYVLNKHRHFTECQKSLIRCLEGLDCFIDRFVCFFVLLSLFYFVSVLLLYLLLVFCICAAITSGDQ